ncbi:type 1 glutamine amidotransferase domain-containing protein [Parendozoicomonas sp. Alg238-R29]|uniref:type 1 glutamine amidotransferase domain-containing protein n=1 Tax=Parendozoicomonas sp. Alg238-R29 TaxID=2993446 RepID=UPI00248D8CA5|nr:type 1 glutamine amidotransferase domain-containing protein [Parendozoicomonas sp. Alg238-R29]
MPRFAFFAHLIAATSLIFLTGCATNTPLNWMGLHPEFDAAPITLKEKRALVITTSQATLGEGGSATGVFASEMTGPYYQFLNSGMDVDIASIKGGKIPVDPLSFYWFIKAESDQHYLEDKEFQAKTNNSLKIDDVNINDYDIVFLSGGWGAAYDFGYSDVLGEKISQAYAQNKAIGGVCHGPLGLLKARKPDGSLLVNGLKMTAVTDRQVSQLFVTETPQHPENELRKAGADFESDWSLIDIFSNHVVTDGRIITGQNQNAGEEVAYKLMELIKNNQ